MVDFLFSAQSCVCGATHTDMAAYGLFTQYGEGITGALQFNNIICVRNLCLLPLVGVSEVLSSLCRQKSVSQCQIKHISQ